MSMSLRGLPRFVFIEVLKLVGKAATKHNYIIISIWMKIIKIEIIKIERHYKFI